MSWVVREAVCLASLEEARAVLAQSTGKDEWGEPLLPVPLTHVLTADVHELPFALPKTVTNHLRIGVTDESHADLLTHLPACVAFMQQALGNGCSVLVHCHAGVSRSATVVLAFLMVHLDLAPREAFRVLKKARRSVKPNEGFQAQIKLFEVMGRTLDKSHPEYRMYRLNHIVDEQMSGRVEPASLAPDPGLRPQGLPEGTKHTIRCRRCRRVLLTEANLLDHEPGSGQTSFSWRRREALSTSYECSSLFMEPMEWLQELLDGRAEGKICCPKCQSRLGQYSWIGSQCSCGAWIVPAMQIHRSKVDVMSAPTPPAQPPSRSGASLPQAGALPTTTATTTTTTTAAAAGEDERPVIR